MFPDLAKLLEAEIWEDDEQLKNDGYNALYEYRRWDISVIARCVKKLGANQGLALQLATVPGLELLQIWIRVHFLLSHQPWLWCLYLGSDVQRKRESSTVARCSMSICCDVVAICDLNDIVQSKQRERRRKSEIDIRLHLFLVLAPGGSSIWIGFLGLLDSGFDWLILKYTNDFDWLKFEYTNIWVGTDVRNCTAVLRTAGMTFARAG